MLKMFVWSLSLYNIRNRGVFLLCKITNLLIYSIEVKNDSYVVLKKADLPKDTLVKNGVKSVVVADMPLERAQSVMAEGGILIKGYMPQANVLASITVQTGWEAIHYLGHCMVVKQQQGLP